MLAPGPICKRAVDLEPLLRVFVGEKISKLKLDEPVDLKTLKVFYQEESGDIRCSKVNGELRSAMLKAVEHLRGITGAATKVLRFFCLALFFFKIFS